MGDAPPQDVQQLIHSHGGGLDQFHQGGAATGRFWPNTRQILSCPSGPQSVMMFLWRLLLGFPCPNRFHRIGRRNRHPFSPFNYGGDSRRFEVPKLKPRQRLGGN